MFIGHIAVGFASKRLAPRTSLGLLVAAAMFADLLWPVLLFTGAEQVRIDPAARWSNLDFVSYPWSHSLLFCCVWAILFSRVYGILTRDKRGADVIFFCVVSHWVLDWISHRPDMPLWPGGARYGLGLWNSIAGTMTVELAMLAAGLWLYLRSTRARVSAIIWMSVIAQPILIAWAWWFDRHRTARSAPLSKAVPVAG